MIQLSNVTFSYSAQTGPVFKDFSIVFETASHTVVSGPDGAGKTTLAGLIKGSLEPSSGRVSTDIDGNVEIGYVGQDPNDHIVGVTIEEDVVFGLENMCLPPAEIRDRLNRALSWTGLSGMEDRLTYTLSGGEQQRLALAGWLAMGCRALILDEALSMLDRAARASVRRFIRELRDSMGLTTIEIANTMEQILSSDRVVFVTDGSIRFDGAPLQFLADETGCRWARFNGGLGGLAAELHRRGTPASTTDGIDDLHNYLLETILRRNPIEDIPADL